MKLALIKFLVGGLAVTLSYIISVILPWKELGGVFATFAVFLVSLFITGMQHGDVIAKHVSRGAVFGMTGVLISILATWAMLYFTNHWLLSIVTGFIAWFVSAVIILKRLNLLRV